MDSLTSELNSNILNTSTGSKKRRQKKSSIAVSTPLQNKSDNYDSFKLFSIDDQLVQILKKIIAIEKDWSSKLKESCLTYNKLATQIVKTQRELTNNSHHNILNMLNDNLLQTNKYMQGYLVESLFDKIDTELQFLEHGHSQVKMEHDRLVALYKVCCHQIKPSMNISMSSEQDLATIILWEPLLQEINGLIDRMNKDVLNRRYLISIICSNVVNKLQLANFWHDSQFLVRWNSVIDIANYLIGLASR